MLKKTLLVTYILMFLSCKETLYVDDVYRSKFCDYFTIRTGTYSNDGKTYNTASPKINSIKNDKVSSFIQNHSHRFDYILWKSYREIERNNSIDSSVIKQKFCELLSNDSFYNYFIHLTSGNRKKGYKQLTFTSGELMKVASRFFMCDNIREKDTAIAYHICVGLNGISELATDRDYTVLEAFCFEAIFRNLQNKPRFIDNFHSYINQASTIEKQKFTDFKSQLAAVKNRCYVSMENDKDLERELWKYYNKNISNINFKIE
jgi:hypothetical protein